MSDMKLQLLAANWDQHREATIEGTVLGALRELAADYERELVEVRKSVEVQERAAKYWWNNATRLDKDVTKLRAELEAEKVAHRKASSDAHHWEEVATNRDEETKAARADNEALRGRLDQATRLIDVQRADCPWCLAENGTHYEYCAAKKWLAPGSSMGEAPKHKCGEAGAAYPHSGKTGLYYCSHCRTSFRIGEPAVPEPAPAPTISPFPCGKCGGPVSVFSSLSICDKCTQLWNEAFEYGRAYGRGERVALSSAASSAGATVVTVEPAAPASAQGTERDDKCQHCGHVTKRAPTSPFVLCEQCGNRTDEPASAQGTGPQKCGFVGAFDDLPCERASGHEGDHGITSTAMKTYLARWAAAPEPAPATCGLCDIGHPLDGEYHIPTQRKGMIPVTRCRKLPPLPESAGPFQGFLCGHRGVSDDGGGQRVSCHQRGGCRRDDIDPASASAQGTGPQKCGLCGKGECSGWHDGTNFNDESPPGDVKKFLIALGKRVAALALSVDSHHSRLKNLSEAVIALEDKPEPPQPAPVPGMGGEVPTPVERHGFVPRRWAASVNPADDVNEKCAFPDCGQPRSAAVHEEGGK